MELRLEHYPDEFCVWPSLWITRGEAVMTHEPEGLEIRLSWLLWGVALVLQ